MKKKKITPIKLISLNEWKKFIKLFGTEQEKKTLKSTKQ